MANNIHTFRSAELRKVVEEATTHFIEAPIDTLPPTIKFNAGGVYALYYQGGFELYRKLAAKEIKKETIPIYVGKAVPAGWRTARKYEAKGIKLYSRINEHYRNIVSAQNLDPQDFKCRYMILDEDESGIIGPVEAALIRKYEPLWNTVIDGFGNHTPGAGRFDQAKSGWDVLHPGRKWAEKCRGAAPRLEDLEKKIKNYFDRKKFN